MSASRHLYTWRPESVADDGLPLRERLRELAEDRVSSTAPLLREASERLSAWLRTRDDAWTAAEAREELRDGLADFEESHAWRAPVATWADTLRATVELWAGRTPRASGESSAASASRGTGLRETLFEEVGLWLTNGLEDEVGVRGLAPEGRRWNGRPLAGGTRIPAREACGASLVADSAGMVDGELIAVHGWSETVVLLLEALHDTGLRPEVVTSEGGPDLGGRRIARRLVARGLRVQVVYDAALFAALARCDRLWIGSEAIGREEFLARVGTTALLHEAGRQGVERALFATSDKCREGELALPAWCERDRWLLWEGAPEGVRVDSQAFERAPLRALDRRYDEHGARAVLGRTDGADPTAEVAVGPEGEREFVLKPALDPGADQVADWAADRAADRGPAEERPAAEGAGDDRRADDTNARDEHDRAERP